MARVLVIEDDHSIAMMLAFVLGHQDHVVEICTDGSEAMARLDGEPTDAVVTDVMLPSDETGLDVVRELRRRQEWRDVPAIIVSALGDDGHQWNGWRAGATGYLAKPFDTEDLLALIDEQVGHEDDAHDERHAIPHG